MLALDTDWLSLPDVAFTADAMTLDNLVHAVAFEHQTLISSRLSLNFEVAVLSSLSLNEFGPARELTSRRAVQWRALEDRKVAKQVL